MPTPAKPCNASFSDEVISALIANNDRAQWMTHPCSVCGQHVGARLHLGKWSPEPHWPSVSYAPRAVRAEKRSRVPANQAQG
ncbi:hypothetical protein SAMN05421770_101328 [Granulicella rosea]|uniref:Uncharacterized protein n=1 Tax=Granulicella rosea TaxID=474952 RepID=A0A239D762_9BACT|nr:hypothetical protein [Granulicella rosea]SNS28215.1 hypothetical protein SAMN05421770_101328 [Granulicella rosea]